MGFIYDNDINGIPIIVADGWIFICCILLGIAKIKYKNVKKDNNRKRYIYKSPSRDSKKLKIILNIFNISNINMLTRSKFNELKDKQIVYKMYICGGFWGKENLYVCSYCNGNKSIDDKE